MSRLRALPGASDQGGLQEGLAQDQLHRAGAIGRATAMALIFVTQEGGGSSQAGAARGGGGGTVRT